jgi:hypothetical protein
VAFLCGLGTGATNALFIADVGQGDREEINIEPPNQGGRNYGWRVYEGTLENTRVAALGPAYLPLQSPSFEYTHAVGQAVTGGFVYRGSALGVAYRGRYFYADCVQGKIFSLPGCSTAAPAKPSSAPTPTTRWKWAGPSSASAPSRATRRRAVARGLRLFGDRHGPDFVIEAAAAAPAPPSGWRRPWPAAPSRCRGRRALSSAATSRPRSGFVTGQANLATRTTTAASPCRPCPRNPVTFVRDAGGRLVGTSAPTGEPPR